MGTLYETTGLNVSVFQPIIVPGTSYNAEGRFICHLASELSSYSHAIAAMGGYTEASIQFSVPFLSIQDWVNYGLGRHVAVKDHALCPVWEGFVNQIEITLGGLALTIGPLMAIGNRVRIVYSKIIDDTVDPPVVGSTEQGAIAEDDDSRTKYGTIEKVLSAGTCTTQEANDYRDAYLAHMAWPSASTMLAVGRADVPTVRLDCQGYNAWLDAYVYETATTGTTTLSTKLLAVLAYCNDALFSTDYTHVDTNAYLTSAEEQDLPTALTVIQALTALGDVSNNRWTFGIYDKRMAHYHVIPTLEQTAYRNRLTDKLQVIETMGGQPVYPWSVRPAQWLFLSDFIIGKSALAGLYQDPRYMFIEEVRYTAPWELELNGQRAGTLNQLVAKMGLGGMG